jgi:hypothetical protein
MSRKALIPEIEFVRADDADEDVSHFVGSDRVEIAKKDDFVTSDDRDQFVHARLHGAHVIAENAE